MSTSTRSPAILAPPSDIPAIARKSRQSRTSIKLNWWLPSGWGSTWTSPLRANEKPTLLTRRQVLASGAAMAGAIPFLPTTRAAAPPEPRAGKLRLTAGTRTLAVNGKPARVFSLIGPNEKPGITLSPGERFDVDLVNQTGTSTIIHWHSQLA